MTAMLLALAMVAQAKKEPDRVGRIIIEGTTDTPDYVILDFALPNQRPGRILRYAELDAARKFLGCGLFDRANPPTVEVLPNEPGDPSPFKDIRVRVTERPDAWAYYAVIDTVIGVVLLLPRNLECVAERVLKKLNPKE